MAAVVKCGLRFERVLWKSGVQLVAGIDEAGRGPLAGPVAAAAVILPQRFRHRKLTDSKRLAPEVREKIYAELTVRDDVCWAVAMADVNEIDRFNILRATHQAMRAAVSALRLCPNHVLIDGLPVTPFPISQTALIDGDEKSFSIAAASVIAKVTRDRFMAEMDSLYPDYGFAQHKGYSTPLHFERLRAYGPCPIHRRSFLPVEQALLGLF